MRTARMVDEPWLQFLIHCSIFYLLASSMASSQNLNQSNIEVKALLEFKQNSIKADPKGFLEDWSPSSLSPCSWVGVSCSLTGQVSSLNFTNAGLIGRLHIDDLIVLENLKHLYLSGNSFSGNLFHDKASYPCIIETLDLSFNNLSEPISETFFQSCDRLTIFQVPFNNISGAIPPSLGNLTKLQVLNLNSNAFSGNIPSKLCSSSSLQKLQLAGNFLSGQVPSDIGNCKNLRTIDFSLNNLNGTIPANLWMLPNLSDLIRWGNSFSGEIPKDICLGQSNFEALILNNNLFSGTIPESFRFLSLLSDLDLSNNNLSGSIPTAGQLETFPASRFENNSGLCGFPLPPCGSEKSPTETGLKKSEADDLSTGKEFDWIWLAAWIGFINGAIIGVFGGIILFEVKNQWFLKIFRITPRRPKAESKNRSELVKCLANSNFQCTKTKKKCTLFFSGKYGQGHQILLNLNNDIP